MRVTRELKKISMREPITWTELLGMDERPDELRYEDGSWVVRGGAEPDEDDGKVWQIAWPTAVVVEVDHRARADLEDERPTLIERPRSSALAAI